MSGGYAVLANSQARTSTAAASATVCRRGGGVSTHVGARHGLKVRGEEDVYAGRCVLRYEEEGDENGDLIDLSG